VGVAEPLLDVGDIDCNLCHLHETHARLPWPLACPIISLQLRKARRGRAGAADESWLPRATPQTALKPEERDSIPARYATPPLMELIMRASGCFELIRIFRFGGQSRSGVGAGWQC
jgi:hypothetical protein